MSLTWIIGLSVVVTLVLLLGGHFILHSLIKFKMDESTIVQFLASINSGYPETSAEEIAAQTQLTLERVKAVCAKSKLL